MIHFLLISYILKLTYLSPTLFLLNLLAEIIIIFIYNTIIMIFCGAIMIVI